MEWTDHKSLNGPSSGPKKIVILNLFQDLLEGPRGKGKRFRNEFGMTEEKKVSDKKSEYWVGRRNPTHLKKKERQNVPPIGEAF